MILQELMKFHNITKLMKSRHVMPIYALQVGLNQVSHYVVHPHALVPGTKYSHLVRSFPLTLLLLPYRMRDTTTTNLYTEEEEKVAEEEWEDTTTTTTARLWRLLHLSSHSLPD